MHAHLSQPQPLHVPWHPLVAAAPHALTALLRGTAAATGALPLLSCRRAYCSYADAIFPPLWLSLICVLVSSRIMPLWQLLLLGGASFWGGLYVMAVKWAGVPTRRLSLSRAVPMFVVSLELLCTGEL